MPGSFYFWSVEEYDKLVLAKDQEILALDNYDLAVFNMALTGKNTTIEGRAVKSGYIYEIKCIHIKPCERDHYFTINGEVEIIGRGYIEDAEEFITNRLLARNVKDSLSAEEPKKSGPNFFGRLFGFG